MFRRPRPIVMRIRALPLAVCLSPMIASGAVAQEAWSSGTAAPYSTQLASWIDGADTSHPATAAPAAIDLSTWGGATPHAPQPRLAQATPVGETWITPAEDRPQFVDDDDYFTEPGWDGGPVVGPCPSNHWFWQVLPDGLIYHSYWAGVHEPRISIVAFRERDGRSLWDGALGGRVGLLRYGTCDPLYPQGWELDVEAAAIVRLTLDEIRDFETADYRVGIPLTYGVDNWQFKFAVYHLSSHLGDEFAIANPGSLDARINYVRDALVLGASYYPHPAWRLYSEAAYTVNVDGGAKPWEFQFGTELSQPGPTGLHGTPFLAINAHLREEHNFGGDTTAQTGWLWRGLSGQTMRMGFHYFNGKSSQYQTFNDSEEQIGFGLWYDY